MPEYNCPCCQNPFTAPSGASAAHARCPHCDRTVELPKSPAARWYYARAKKKYGPYTWNQLVSLASDGQVHPDDLLLQEGTKQWVRARTMTALFGKPLPHAETADHTASATVEPVGKVRRKPNGAAKPAAPTLRWRIVGTGGVGLGLLVGLSIILAWYFSRDPAPVPPPVNQHKPVDEDKKPDKELKPKKIDSPKNDVDTKEKKTRLEDKKPPTHELRARQLLAELNRVRKIAGLGSVTLDEELSRGCLAHSQYLAKHIDPAKANGANLRDEEPDKPGYSSEGKNAAQAALFALGDPDAILSHWMGKLVPRTLLLNPDIHSVGIGLADTPQGPWFCALDAVRGRGEPIVVFPAPRQENVPQSFSGGLEVADDKAAAGFPITVTFPAGKVVANAQIELCDAKGNRLDGWRWTPEKPLRPEDGRNTIALISKGLLLGNSLYQAKSSALVDGKPWNLAWTFTTDDDLDGKGLWAKKALARINAYRGHAGLKPVLLDDTLRENCLKHARYLVMNEGHPSLQGLKAHGEDLTLPGASKEGHESGKISNIAIGDIDPLDGLDAWMATLYHRVPILDPRLERIGFACARGRRQAWVTVLNVTTGRSAEPRSQVVYYPAADQVGVPLHFPLGGEEPNPIVDDKDGRAGYPITATFPESEPLKGATGKLTDEQGKEVPCWFSSPEKLANKDFADAQRSTVCFIAKDPLAVRTKYHIQLQGTLAGKPWEKKWKFTTGEAGLSVEAAARLVLERLNVHRAQAGLAAVTLDDKLAKGCQRHAEYLVKNADVLMKKNASVNDEDPLLPGYSDEGRRSARQAFVFSNAPTPLMQIDDLMATFLNRVPVLNPRLERLGFGCSLDVGRGWRCVLDVNGGIGDARVLLYPAPEQTDVPCLGFDTLDGVKASAGFPITMSFPRQTSLRAAQAVLRDVKGDNVNVWVSSPEKPLHKNLTRPTIAVHPLTSLQPGRTYEVTVEAFVDGVLTRRTWLFTTAEKAR